MAHVDNFSTLSANFPLDKNKSHHSVVWDGEWSVILFGFEAIIFEKVCSCLVQAVNFSTTIASMQKDIEDRITIFCYFMLMFMIEMKNYFNLPKKPTS